MKTILSVAMLVMFIGSPNASAQAQTPAGGISAADSAHADAYYYFTMGHLQEQQFEDEQRRQLATQSIESYKKALELDPDSAVILERLAEIYAKSQHIRDAVMRGAGSAEDRSGQCGRAPAAGADLRPHAGRYERGRGAAGKSEQRPSSSFRPS